MRRQTRLILVNNFVLYFDYFTLPYLTLPIFNLSGNTPISNILFITWDTTWLIIFETCFRGKPFILSLQAALSLFKLVIIVSTLFGIVGVSILEIAKRALVLATQLPVSICYGEYAPTLIK